MSVASLAAQMHEVDISALGTPRIEFVYALFCRGELVYIGRTVSLMPRLAAHRVGRGDWKPGKVFDQAFVLEVSTEDAAACEGALIRRFNPPLCSSAPNRDETRDVEMLARFGLEYHQGNRDAFVARRKQIFSNAQRIRREHEGRRARWRASSLLWRATVRHLNRLEQRRAS